MYNNNVFKLFSSKKVVFYFQRQKLSAYVVADSKQPSIESQDEIQYGNSTDSTDRVKLFVLGFLKKNHYPVRCVIDDNFAFVSMLSAQNGHINRNEVQKIAEEEFPEVLDNIHWDYKVVNIVGLDGVNSQYFQVEAVLKTFDNFFRYVVELSKVELIEPVSVAISRVAVDLDKPHIIIYLGDSPMMVFSYKGNVFKVRSTIGIPQPMDVIKAFAADMVQKYSMRPFYLVSSSEVERYSEQLSEDDFTFQLRDLSPIYGIMLNKNIKGEDKNILNMILRS